MSKNLKCHINVLTYACRIKSPLKRQKFLCILGEDHNIYLAIQEILLNAIKGNIKLNSKQKQQLDNNQKYIRPLLKKPVKSKLRQKKLVTQSGKFLPMLIPALAAIVAASV